MDASNISILAPETYRITHTGLDKYVAVTITNHNLYPEAIIYSPNLIKFTLLDERKRPVRTTNFEEVDWPVVGVGDIEILKPGESLPDALQLELQPIVAGKYLLRAEYSNPFHDRDLEKSLKMAVASLKRRHVRTLEVPYLYSDYIMVHFVR